MRAAVGLGLVCCLLAACGEGEIGSIDRDAGDATLTRDAAADSGARDASEADAGVRDAIAADARDLDANVETDAAPDADEPDAEPEQDAAEEDAGDVDGGVDDGGGDDGGAPDSGAIRDAGSSDTGPQDAGPQDAGPQDAGPQDAGPRDTGPRDTGPADTGLAPDSGFAADAEPAMDASSARVPLIDLAGSNYLGYAGGLYPNASNDLPAAHLMEGITRALEIEPLDVNGVPNVAGTAVMLSIGMSNTTQEFCSGLGTEPCNAWTFMGQALMLAGLNTELTIKNGAMGGRAASSWDSSNDADYDRVRDNVLAPDGLSEAQVQIVWAKVANPNPTVSLPAGNADAFALEASLGNILRALKTRYPNLKQVFLSTRIYGGYAAGGLNPEPQAYESGFAAKWVIEAQIAQMAGAAADAISGDLDYDTVAPWVAWGPYLWADGLNPRSDGLIWERADLEADAVHPSRSGEEKVGDMLLDFFTTSPVTRCWFLTAGTCP